jgi:hypothetical protein
MSPLLSPRDILSVLRKRMKSLKYTYSDAALVLGVSLPSVKRFFTSEDVPLARVLRLAEWLELSLQDIADLVKQSELSSHTFTIAQEEFLAKNPSHLAFLLALYQQNKTPEEIAEKYKLSGYSTQRYLNELEKLGLIAQRAKGKINFFINGALSWEVNGPLAKAFTSKLVQSLSDRVLQQLETNSKDAFLIIRGATLSDDAYGDFKREALELSRKYELISALTKKNEKSNKSNRVTFSLLADRWEDSVFTNIANL